MQRDLSTATLLLVFAFLGQWCLVFMATRVHAERIEIEPAHPATLSSRNLKLDSRPDMAISEDDVSNVDGEIDEEEEESRKDQVKQLKSGVNSLLNVLQNIQPLDEDDAEGSVVTGPTVDPAFQKWIRFAEVTREITNEIFPMMMREVYKIGAHIPDLSDGCIQAMLELLFGLKQEKLWAFKMLDATGKIPSGILVGTAVELGNYDECIAISVKKESYAQGVQEEQFRGSYCRADYRLPLPPIKDPSKVNMKTKIYNFENTSLAGTYIEHLASFSHLTYEAPMRIGVCVPSACSRYEIEKIINTVLKRLELQTVNITSCDTKEDYINLTNSRLAVIGFFAALFMMVVIGTTLEFIFHLRRDKDSKESAKGLFARCILCFSAYANTKKLVDTRVSEPSLASLNGIRVLSMAWIILGHCYCFNTKIIYNSTSRFMDVVEGVPFQAIMNTFVLVDTFFFMGALLATYAHFTLLQKTKGRANTFMLIVYRIIRLFPSLVFVVAFVFVWPLISSGPYWPDIVLREYEKCRRSWWSTLLFFTNWLNIYDMCLIHTWYIAADIQLFIVFLFVPVVIFKWPSVGLMLNGALCFIGVVSAAVIPVIEGVTPVLLYNTPIETQIAYVANRTHFRTYTHLQSYAVGVFLAYIFYKNPKISLKPVSQAAVWFCSLAVALAVLCSTYKWSAGEKMELLPSILYAATSRIGWCMAVAWVIYACATNRGGIVNSLLSWKLFVPLGRLCYQIYLIHLIVIWSRFAMFRERLNFTHYETVCESMVVCGISIGAAFVVNLLVEAPIGRLSKLLLTPKSVKSSNDEGDSAEKVDKPSPVPQELPAQNVSSRL